MPCPFRASRTAKMVHGEEYVLHRNEFPWIEPLALIPPVFGARRSSWPPKFRPTHQSIISWWRTNRRRVAQSYANIASVAQSTTSSTSNTRTPSGPQCVIILRASVLVCLCKSIHLGHTVAAPKLASWHALPRGLWEREMKVQKWRSNLWRFVISSSPQLPVSA